MASISLLWWQKSAEASPDCSDKTCKCATEAKVVRLQILLIKKQDLIRRSPSLCSEVLTSCPVVTFGVLFDLASVLQLVRLRVTSESTATPSSSPALLACLATWNSLTLTQLLPLSRRHCSSVGPCAMARMWTCRPPRSLSSRYTLLSLLPFCVTSSH